MDFLLTGSSISKWTKKSSSLTFNDWAILNVVLSISFLFHLQSAINEKIVLHWFYPGSPTKLEISVPKKICDSIIAGSLIFSGAFCYFNIWQSVKPCDMQMLHDILPKFIFCQAKCKFEKPQIFIEIVKYHRFSVTFDNLNASVIRISLYRFNHKYDGGLKSAIFLSLLGMLYRRLDNILIWGVK
jgi:hypothetical protein